MGIRISTEDLVAPFYPMIGHRTDLVWSTWFGKVEDGENRRQSDGGHQDEYGQTNTSTCDESIDMDAPRLDKTEQPDHEEDDGQGVGWEMVPAYALTIIFFMIWLLGLVKPGGIHVNRFIAGGGVGLAVLVLVASIALPTVLPVFHFPKPGGPYQIGTVTYHWVERRHEIFSTDPNAHRQLMVQIWYPVKGDDSSARAPYVQGAGALSPALARLA